MKKTFIILFLTFSGMFTSAYAQTQLTISNLAINQNTKSEFQKMIRDRHLPNWITEDGVESQTKKVEIQGNKYFILTSCKPHDCASQRIAILYAPDSKKLTGVFSYMDENNMTEKLEWLNIPDNLSIDGKTILFAALTGSLDNHPDSFNF